ncbi:uncharacterized protein N7482_000306 [Penicillium canariense]|uniref:Cystathionine gamma-synthase n=1 Tax=Penicillium canariense TaxID=189055 RepID=A0A9W9IBB9_9EURO|nr:uncharacterized protein N7482_000306 [Penicillium canariense]KAJ5174429.1 hypothetical protein N7482_000306 [Penicillium canariense]
MTITTTLPPLGRAIPEGPHAISVHIPTWNGMCSIGRGDPQVMKALRNGYPRTFVHKDIQKLFQACQRRFLSSPAKVLLFLEQRHAQACKSFVTSPAINGDKAAPAKSVSVFALEIGESHPTMVRAGNTPRPTTLWAVVYPEESAPIGAFFWRLTGTGISSRFAEHCLRRIEAMQRIEPPVKRFYSAMATVHPVYRTICTRIACLMERAPAGPRRSLTVNHSDVFLYPSGMSAIYHVHQALLKWRGLESVIIGFPYELTIKMMKTYGPSYKFYSLGTDEQIDDFEAYLDTKAQAGSMIQAVWCECPSNPLLRTVDMERIRRLADKHRFVVVVDETIGSFANVDALGVADVVVTSLSKSFNGYADLLAGSVTLNPNSDYYGALKACLTGGYTNTLYIDDAIQLERNSRNFLKRAAQMNDTAECVVDYLVPFASDPSSVVNAVHYPKTCESAQQYKSRMRQATDEFIPGYGCLFTVDFDTIEASRAFFDSLDVRKGPSLGAHITLAQPYVQMVLQKEKKWAASHGLRETIVRVSVGLEDKEVLLQSVKSAHVMAEKTKGTHAL